MPDLILRPVKSKKLSSRDFLKMPWKERRSIARTQFVPPKIGDRGFGYFIIDYKTPLYEYLHG